MKVKSIHILIILALFCNSGYKLFSQEEEKATSPEAQIEAAQEERDIRIQEAITKIESERAIVNSELRRLYQEGEYRTFIENANNMIGATAIRSEEEILKYLKETNPAKAEALLSIEDKTSAEYLNTIRSVSIEMNRYEAIKERDPERYEIMIKEKKLTSESLQLAGQYKNTIDAKDREEIKNQLTKVLDELFDIRQINRNEEIEQLAQRLAELKETNEKRLANKDEIVTGRLNELLDLRW